MPSVKNLNWFPGHMRKALNQIQETLQNCDCIVQIGDARAPLSSLNPSVEKLKLPSLRVLVYSKKDLADIDKTRSSISSLEKKFSAVFIADFNEKSDIEKIKNYLSNASFPKAEKYRRYNLNPPALKAMVIGIPNVGKSTFINAISKKHKTSVANTPGHTKSQQIVRINDKLSLIDTPGVLEPNYQDKAAIIKLSMLGSVKDQAIDMETIYLETAKFLLKNYPSYVYSRYKIENELTIENFYMEIAKARHFLLANNELDIQRSKTTLLNEFRNGELGRVSIDE